MLRKTLSFFVFLCYLGCAAVFAEDIAMQIQLPFVDGVRYKCIQNSDDSFSHNISSTVFDIDFSLGSGTIVTAAENGIAYRGSDPGGFGNYIKIDHGNGYFSIYAHLIDSGYIAKDGDSVVAGQPIGFSGNTGYSTGSHLHFGLHKGEGTGESVRMEVKAREYESDLSYIKEGFFATGYQGERRDFVVGNYYEAIPLNGIFNQFQCHELDNGLGILCWQGYDGNFAFCDDGRNHVRYFRSNSGYSSESVGINGNNVISMCYPDNSGPADLYSYLMETGVGGDDPNIFPNLPPPNLHIEEFNLHDSAYNLIPDNGSGRLKVGETYEIHVWPESLVEHCLNGTTDEEIEVKTDTFVKIAMSEEDGSWKLLHRSYTRCENMDEDDSKKEIFHYTIPSEAEGKRIFFKSKVDATNVIHESNEDDNWSDTEIYPVEGYCPSCPDFVVTNAKLTCGKIELNLGEKFGLEGDIVNQGNASSPSDIRSAYYLKPPGASSWTYAADDGSGASNFSVGGSEHEYVSDSPFTANAVGVWEGMFCADYLNQVSEMNEENNCQVFSFNVKLVGSDLIISSLGFREGLNFKSGTRVHPWANVRNIGNVTPSSDIRIAYYIDGKYRDDDGVSAGELTPGRDQFESVNNNDIKLGDRGNRTLTVCADYKGQVLELNEANNCASVGFVVRK